MGGRFEIGEIAGLEDAKSFGTLAGATEDEKGGIQGKLTAGKSRLLRVLIGKEQPRTHMPRARRPQFPELETDEELTNRPTLRNIGSRLAQAQAAVNFFAKMKFEAAAIDPPYIQYPAPKLRMEPWSLPDAQFERAAENDVARQKKFGAERPLPSVAQIVSARCASQRPGHRRSNLALGGIGGAPEGFGLGGVIWRRVR